MSWFVVDHSGSGNGHVWVTMLVVGLGDLFVRILSLCGQYNSVLITFLLLIKSAYSGIWSSMALLGVVRISSCRQSTMASFAATNFLEYMNLHSCFGTSLIRSVLGDSFLMQVAIVSRHAKTALENRTACLMQSKTDN